MSEYKYLFSIITVNYNDKEGLKRTIESVLAQDFDNYEHIIIDGGSTDGSVELLHGYEDRYPKGRLHWVSEKDAGIYDGMNKGIQMASGQFLNMMNGGDWLEHGALKTVADSVHKCPQIMTFAGLERLWQEKDHKLAPIQVAQVHPEALAWHVMYHQALFYHADLHKKYGLYRMDLKLASDQAFLLEIFAANKTSFYLIEQVLTNFVKGGRGDQAGREELYGVRKEYFMPQKKTFLGRIATIVKQILPYGFVIFLWKVLKKDFPQEEE